MSRSATGARVRRARHHGRAAQGADRHDLKAVKSKAWAEAMDKNAWTPAVMTGKDFDEFVDREFASLRATMVKAGMI